MPTHVFESKDGKQIERFYEMRADKNPPKYLVVNGKRYYRLWGAGSTVSVERNYKVRAYQFDEDDWKLAKKVGAHIDEEGPILDTKKKIRAFEDQMEIKSQGRARWKHEFGIHNG